MTKKKLNCSKCGPLDDHNNGRCMTCGRMLKGFSLAPKGPRKEAKTDFPKEVIDQVKSLDTMAEKVEFWHKYLVENPKSKVEIERVLTKISDTYKPKLKNVETNTKIDNTITITWKQQIPAAIEEKNPITFDHDPVTKTKKLAKPKKKDK